MEKILVSVPNELAHRMRTAIPQGQRSKIIASLIDKEVAMRERSLYECAVAVENDEVLQQEMADWDTTLQDGLTDESW